MSDFLYERFLDDRRIYRAARAFWFRKMKQILPARDIFLPYVSDKFLNGELFYDGNPIFNAVNLLTGNAVRIIQESPREFGEFYESFENKSSHLIKIDGNHRRIFEKLIILTLTKESYSRAEKEISQWMHD
jgi:hypothetical protein